jgi:hypothetical protein
MRHDAHLPGRVFVHRFEAAAMKFDRRTPGASLHPMLRDKAIGVARVVYPAGVTFAERPSLELLRRLAAGLRRMDEGRFISYTVQNGYIDDESSGDSAAFMGY